MSDYNNGQIWEMIWRLLHRIGLHKNEVSRVHVTDRGHIVFETRCMICGKLECHYD